MDSYSAQVGWTDEQWNRVTKTITEEAQKARVAAMFLPIVGPLDPTVEAIAPLTLKTEYVPAPPGARAPAAGAADRPTRMLVDTDPTLHLATLSTLVYLRSAEVADPELAAALGMFRRAANLLALGEDAIVFGGQPKEGDPPPNYPPARFADLVRVTGGGDNEGLLPTNRAAPNQFPGPGGAAPSGQGRHVIDAGANGAKLVSAVVTAISTVEAAGFPGSFACVLSNDLFGVACTPSNDLVMPRDRILPFVDGRLIRSSMIPSKHGVVVALGGSPVELVIASDITVRFLHTDSEPRYVFRLSERLVLRVKDKVVIALLYST